MSRQDLMLLSEGCHSLQPGACERHVGALAELCPSIVWVETHHQLTVTGGSGPDILITLIWNVYLNPQFPLNHGNNFYFSVVCA